MASGSPRTAVANSFLSLPVLSGAVESPITVDSVRPTCTWQALRDNYGMNEWADERTDVCCAPTPAVGSWCGEQEPETWAITQENSGWS